MKKNYFMLAATAALFAACAETDLVNEIVVEETPQAIGFETFANKATRAENSDKDYLGYLQNHHESFKVWASKLVAENDPTTVVNSQYVPVYADNAPGTVEYANSKWTASPLKYWDKTATMYYFYAAAPSSMSWLYANSEANDGSTGYLTLNDFTLKGTANDNLASVTSSYDSWKELTNATDIDLMIAGLCPIAQIMYNQNKYYSVALNFNHILSRLNINVKAETEATITTTGEGENQVTTTTYSPDIKLSALNVVGLKNKGSFNENASLQIGEEEDKTTGDKTPIYASLFNGTHLRWQNTTQGSESPSSDDNTYTLAAHLGTGSDELQLTSTAQATHKYLIIPQLVSNEDAYANKGTAPTTDAYIKINYTVDGEPFEAYYSLAKAFGIAKDGTLAFNEGWQNTLTITISPNAIQFTGAVALWADTDNNTSDNNGKGDNAAID